VFRLISEGEMVQPLPANNNSLVVRPAAAAVIDAQHLVEVFLQVSDKESGVHSLTSLPPNFM
jgi:hypothetical protein